MRRLESTEALALGGLLLVGGYVAWLGWLMNHSTYDTWGALLIAPVLVMVSLPILARAARSTGQPWLFGLAATALVLKLVASYVRYFVAFIVYDGSADASRYHDAGTHLSQLYRQGIFEASTQAGGSGTQVMDTVTGVVYALTGPSLIGGYLVYAWLGFWGLFLAYLAFRTAVPDGHHRRYAYLVFFLPSLLFWPSGIGKEAWMTLGLGLSMYGVARLLAHLRGGLLLLALGMLVTGAVRPHVTVLIVLALAVSFLLLPSRTVTSMTPVVKVAGWLVLAAAAYLSIRVAAHFLGVEDLSRDGFEAALTDAQEGTAQGGSAFGGAALSSPLGLPWAIVTVLFRPFPWEADNAQALAAALEGLLFMYLTWRYRLSVMSSIRLIRRSPYVTWCLAYVLGYVVMFSGFSNFGILVRQRSLALPAFLVLLALPVVTRERRGSGRSRPREVSLR